MMARGGILGPIAGHLSMLSSELNLSELETDAQIK